MEWSDLSKFLDPADIFTGEYKRKQTMGKLRDEMQGYADEYAATSEAAAQALEALANGLDPSQLTPAQYQSLQEYQPEIAQYVSEQTPNLMTAGGQGRDLMMQQALAAQQMAASGDTPAARAARELQQMDSAALQQQLLGQLQAQARQEGRSSPQTDLMLALGIGKQTQDNLYKQQLQSQAQGDSNRMQALQMLGSAGANLQANDQGVQRTNTDILNQYNQRLARTKWDYEQQKADTANKANMYNIQQRQDAANRNVASRNQAQSDVTKNRLYLQTAAIRAREQGQQQGITSRGQAAQADAGFNVGSNSRQMGDWQQGANLGTSIVDIFRKK